MNEKVKIGVVGVGHLGQTHSRLLKQVTSAELVGVFDTDRSKAKDLAEELGVEAFSSLEELLPAVDAATVVAPTTFHFKIASQLIRNGKHCFIEKPVTTTVDEAEKICELAPEFKSQSPGRTYRTFQSRRSCTVSPQLEPMFVECHRLAQFNRAG